VAANILNKQLWRADRLWSSSLGLGWGLTTPNLKRPACYEVLHKALEMDGLYGKKYVTENGRVSIGQVH